jgi:hypothetical protein
LHLGKVFREAGGMQTELQVVAGNESGNLFAWKSPVVANSFKATALAGIHPALGCGFVHREERGKIYWRVLDPAVR